MASRFQATPLVSTPLYLNSIVWSEENLIAVASGPLITILNPSLPSGPRGLITLPGVEPYPIGVVKGDELMSGCLLPTSLSRDRTPCARSLSWSPVGMSPNSGCLLAVCTVEGRVRIYRSPFCDFCAEWVEVMDITDRLYDYLVNTNFRELYIPSSKAAYGQEKAQGCVDHLPMSCYTDLPKSVNEKGRKRSRGKANSEICEDFGILDDQLLDPRIGDAEILDDQLSGPRIGHSSTGSRHQPMMGEKTLSKVFRTKSGKLGKNIPGNCTAPLITAEEYARRGDMLSSLVIAWSPMISSSFEIPQNASSKRFSILAVGAKSGKISFWRIHAPLCYSVEHSRPTCAMFIGLLQAHTSWITTISLVLVGSSSNQVLMASGSSDGSVKIWQGNGKDLLEATEANNAPFFLLKQVISLNSVPVSVTSLVVPYHSPQKMLLAVGKCSGSCEVWICDIKSCKFDRAGLFNPHVSIVTGLAWAFDGSCLYTCAQDNYVRCWIINGGSLCEVAIPSNTPGLRNSTDLPDVFLSCLGVAASPGNLVIAMVRSIDIDELDPMYEARAQKAVVEFFWIGAQKVDMLSDKPLDFGNGVFHGFPANELASWELNVLWSLRKYEHVSEPLVIWDIVAALLAFKQSIPRYVYNILFKWLSVTYLGSLMDDLTVDKVLTHICKGLSKNTIRQLHLLNIVCRRIVLSELKPDEINSKMNLDGLTGSEGERLALWMELLLSSEKELRERLVGLTFAAFRNHIVPLADIPQPGYWCPAGIAQMGQWVAHSKDQLKDKLKVIASEVARQNGKKGQQGSLSSIELGSEEQCSYCSALVPFDSPEVAFCQGLESTSGTIQKHKLVRCAVSMQVCPPTPLWFCKCCHRWASKLAPETFFTMSSYPSDFKSLIEFSFQEESLKPSCPFCGILLQRLQPEFLLSASPV